MPMARAEAPLSDLYEADYYVWTERQAAALRAGRLAELDLVHLAEEIEDLGTSLRMQVRSRTRTIIEHLLKLQFSPASQPRHGWRRTLRIQRRELMDVITPALRNEVGVRLPELFADARADAVDSLLQFDEREAADALPQTCPYTLDQITGDWLPEGPGD